MNIKNYQRSTRSVISYLYENGWNNIQNSYLLVCMEFLENINIRQYTFLNLFSMLLHFIFVHPVLVVSLDKAPDTITLNVAASEKTC